MGQTATIAPGHAYIYQNNRLFGLVDKEGNELTDAKYTKIRQYNHFLMGAADLGKSWELFSSDGNFITDANCFVPVSEHQMLALRYENNTTIARRMTDSGLVTGVFDVIEGYLGDFSLTHAADRPQALKATLVNSDGSIEELPFQVIGKPVNGNVFIVTTNNMLGAYNIATHRVIVPVHFNMVRYIKDSFLLGWNDARDFQLSNLQGKIFPFDSIVYSAYHINEQGSMASVGISQPKIYNYKGEILGKDVLGYAPNKNCFLVKEKVKYLKPSKMEHTWLEKEVSWLTDTYGRPLISATDNKDSLVEHLLGNLYAIYSKDGPFVKYISAIYHSDKKRIIVSANKPDKIVWQPPFVAINTNDKWQIMDGDGRVVANVPYLELQTPKQNLDALVHKLSFEGGLIWRNHPNSDTWHIIHDGAPELAFQQVRFCHDRSMFMGKQRNKWGLYRYKVNDGIVATVTEVVPPKYDSINDWTYGKIYRLTKDNEYIWVNAHGETLLGGKSFEYVSPMFLPDGTALAFEGERSLIDEKDWGLGNGVRREFLASKLIITDAKGNIQYQQAIESSNKVLIYFPKEDVTKVALVNGYSVVANNVLYNLKEQKSEQLLSGYEAYSLLLVKGRAISLTGFKGSKNYNQVGAITNPKYNPWFNREWRRVVTVSLTDKKRVSKITGTPLPFFSDATGFYNARDKSVKVIISDDGSVYE